MSESLSVLFFGFDKGAGGGEVVEWESEVVVDEVDIILMRVRR